jgi:hypothetical protein
MKKSKILLLIFIFSLTGCVARTYWTGYRPQPRGYSDKEILIFYPGDKLPKKWVPVGSMRVDGWYFTPDNTLLEGALKTARKKGGDAIIVGEFGSVSASTLVSLGGTPAQFSGVAATDGNIAAVGIQYTAPTPPSQFPITVAWPALSALVIKWVK